MKGEEIVLSIMLLVSASTFMMAQTPVDKSVGKGRQMTSAVVHSNRIEGVKEDKSVELEVKKLLITSKYNLNKFGDAAFSSYLCRKICGVFG